MHYVPRVCWLVGSWSWAVYAGGVCGEGWLVCLCMWLFVMWWWVRRFNVVGVSVVLVFFF